MIILIALVVVWLAIGSLVAARRPNPNHLPGEAGECPGCGFTYAYDGVLCALCNRRHRRPFLAFGVSLAWPVVVGLDLRRRIRECQALPPANSHPGRIVPEGLPTWASRTAGGEVEAIEEGTKCSVPGSLINLETEQALLGAMIFDNSVIDGALELIDRAEMFGYAAHRPIYEAITWLHQERRSVDLITVRDELIRRRCLDDAGGTEYLAVLVESVPNARNAREYASVVAEKARLRGITASTEARVTTLREAVREVFSEISMGEAPRCRGLRTGFFGLDDLLSGLQAGNLYVVAGRPSMGKTSFVMSILEHALLRESRSALIFTPEVSGRDVAQAMICSHAKVDASYLRRGQVTVEEFQRLILSAGAMHEAKLFLDDSTDLTLGQMRSRARQINEKERIALVVVDGMQRLGPIAAASLKAMARELHVPVLTTAPVGRAAEYRRNHRPLLCDLRDAGSLEEEADAILILFREEYYDPNCSRPGLCEVNVAKNRSGPAGSVELAFLGQFARFENQANSAS